MVKERLDQALVEKGLAGSREQGKALIMAGQVYVNGKKAEKPGTAVKADDIIEVRGRACPYVSRGGLKLEKAIKSFGLDFTAKTVLDIGASTGGFTHCALLHKAEKVYAVDVGYGQLAWSLRSDPRVVNLERTNARYLAADMIPEQVDIVTIDVAFISLERIIPAVNPLLKEDGLIIALIKPQFEAGREKVGKKGVVRDIRTHLEVVQKIILFSRELGLVPDGIDYSPVRGPQGNIEFLLLLKKEKDTPSKGWEKEVEAVVKKAHEELC